MLKTLQYKLARFLESLAKANQESFGNQPLRCCTLEKRGTDGSRKENRT